MELRPVPPDAIYENYFHTVVGWLTQAGMDAVGGWGIDLGVEGTDAYPDIQALLEARDRAAEEGPTALQGLVDTLAD